METMEAPHAVQEPSSHIKARLEDILEQSRDNPEAISTALVHGYYPKLYRLAYGMLDDPDGAVFSAFETLVTLLVTASEYHGETSAQNWVYQAALDQNRGEYRRLKRLRWWKAAIPFTRKPADFGASTPNTYLDAELWLALDNTDEPNRTVALLYYLMQWSAAEIASYFHLTEIEAAHTLKSLRKRFATALEPFALSEDALAPEALDARLAASFGQRWPAIQPTPVELEEIRAMVVQQASHRRRD
jgi:DNA-directed RNA polymerase specialized sigma24 family protein